MKSKLYTVEDAIRLFIKDGSCVSVAGFGKSTVAEELVTTMETSFLETGSPKELSIVIGGGNVVLDHFGHEGMVSKVLAGHYGDSQNMKKLIAENKCQSWNIPQGTVAHLLRAGAQGEPALITKVGLGTYVDPRLEGARMNAVTTEDIVEVVEIHGEEYLRIKVPKVDVCILRGTFADEFGNVSFRDEMYGSYTRYAAMCTKAMGGKVIVECREYVKNGSIPAKEVAIPGVLVDAITVISDPVRFYATTPKTVYSSALLGRVRLPLDPTSYSMPLNERKIIGRRASLELLPGDVVNIGIGMPQAVSTVVSEEGCMDEITLSAEIGIIGGAPAPGEPFGTHVNPQAIWDEDIQFDFYHGGLLNAAFLGMAQVNAAGDVNVSKFSPLVTGCGGFINIVSATPTIIFCGAFTAGGLKEAVEDGKLVILQEGKAKKFTRSLLQTTFSAKRAVQRGQRVLFVTERAVFRLTGSGICLEEIAPGVELERDVLGQMEFRPILSENLKPMDSRIFGQGPMDLKETLKTASFTAGR